MRDAPESGKPIRVPWVLLALLLCAAVIFALTWKPLDEEIREDPPPEAEPVPLQPTVEGQPTNRDPAARLVAMGDLHGDLDATRRALRLAGAIDADDRWIGGELVVAQTGDQIDRGDQDREILDLFARLAEEAAAAGGAVVALNGNHEVMNVQGTFEYASPASLAAFGELEGQELFDFLPEAERGRAAAFAPGGSYARLLAARCVIAVVGGTVFVHGGVLPRHVEYGIDQINREMRVWMSGAGSRMPAGLGQEDSPIWSRHYSDAPDVIDCGMLGRALDELGARRMVVGHTIQKEGISSACDERVWRIDTGMSAHYGGSVEVLEILDDEGVRVIHPPDD